MRKVLTPVPTDSIQCCAANQQLLAISAWDNSIHLYNLVSHAQIFQFQTSSPVLTLCFHGKILIYGCSDGSIYDYSTDTQKSTLKIKLSSTIRNLFVFKGYLIVTQLNCELVALNLATYQKVATQVLPQRAFAASLNQDVLLVATACRQYLLYKLVPTNEGKFDFQLLQKKESPLRHQTRSCILFAPNKPIIASVEGRVAVEGDESFAFRAHKTGDTDVISYPVNSMAAYQNKFLFTAASDGFVYVWDLKQRKKVYKIQETYQVAQICISGDLLIVAKSYNWENRESGKNTEEIECVVYNIKEFGI